MDAETRTLCRVLREREALQAKLVVNDRALRTALRDWSDSRPGQRGGIATEAGARFILRQVGAI